MSNLIPERRTDKNGVTRTRWVKPDAARTGTTTIPAPASPPAAVKPVQTPLWDEYMSGHPKADMSKCKMETRVSIEKALGQTAENFREHAWLKNHMVHAVNELENGDATSLNNLAMFWDVADCNSYSNLPLHLEGLRSYTGFENVSDFTTLYSPLHKKQARAIIYATHRLDHRFTENLGGMDSADYGDYDEDEGYDGFNDIDDYEPERVVIYRDWMRDLILTHPDSVTDIVAMVRNEGITDQTLITERVTHPEKSLMEGVL